MISCNGSNRRSENEWKAFVEICLSQLAFNPQDEGILAGSIRLANHEGPWRAVWERYREAPRRYPNIPAQIEKCRPPSDTMFWHMEGGSFEGWPQWNDEQEKSLRQDLMALACMPAHEARVRIKELEKQHENRRTLVWAELGSAPLAYAVKYLACLADTTQKNLAAGTVDDLTAGYCSYGWQADDSVLRALAQVPLRQRCEPFICRGRKIRPDIFNNWWIMPRILAVPARRQRP